MKPSKLKKCCLLCLLLLLLLHSLVMNAQKYSITYKIDQQIDFLVCHLSDTLTGVSSLQDAGIYYSKEQTLLHLIEMKFKIQIADCDSLYLYHKTLFKKTKNKQDQVNTEYYRVSKEESRD